MKAAILIIAAALLFQCGLTAFAWSYGGAEFALTHAVLPFAICAVVGGLPGFVFYIWSLSK